MDRGQSDAPSDREQSAHSLDRGFWDQRWSEVLREHAAQVAQRPPNAYLTATVGSLAPGRALDAGCGHGSEALWLAARGWQVTAVDFSATVLAHGRSTAATLGPGIAERIDWVEGDLAIWTPEAGLYDLVTSLYVHVAGRMTCSSFRSRWWPAEAARVRDALATVARPPVPVACPRGARRDTARTPRDSGRMDAGGASAGWCCPQ